MTFYSYRLCYSDDWSQHYCSSDASAWLIHGEQLHTFSCGGGGVTAALSLPPSSEPWWFPPCLKPPRHQLSLPHTPHYFCLSVRQLASGAVHVSHHISQLGPRCGLDFRQAILERLVAVHKLLLLCLYRGSPTSWKQKWNFLTDASRTRWWRRKVGSSVACYSFFFSTDGKCDFLSTCNIICK